MSVGEIVGIEFLQGIIPLVLAATLTIRVDYSC
jgi:hypothetical protein